MSILYVVDSDRYETIVHRIDTDLGRYLMPFKMKGAFYEQTDALIKRMFEDNPYQVVFDEFGVGRGLADYFRYRANNEIYAFSVDMNGNVRYGIRG